ncbi:MAG: Rieske (2Fe-2S) protein [Chloroflexota bacterium]
MADYMDAMSTQDLQDGQMKAVELKGNDILVARSGDQFYAASNVCPHMKARLSGGTLDGSIVSCPRHASRFDLRDGHVVRWTDWSGLKFALVKMFRSPRPLPTYKTRVEGDRLKIEV